MPAPCRRLVGVSETHEPPIIISGGSLQMECEKKMHREGKVSAGPRRYLYEFDKYPYGVMVYLQVINEYAKVFTSDCYNLDGQKLPDGTPIEEPMLKIWLQQLVRVEQDGDEEVPVWRDGDIDPANEPHILITYRTESDSMRDMPPMAVIETDKKFDGGKQSFRGTKTFKHRHKGYSGKHYRIGRWMLVNKNGRTIAGNYAGLRPLNNGKFEQLSGFQLIPRFVHLEELRERMRAGSKR